MRFEYLCNQVNPARQVAIMERHRPEVHHSEDNNHPHREATDLHQAAAARRVGKMDIVQVGHHQVSVDSGANLRVDSVANLRADSGANLRADSGAHLQADSAAHPRADLEDKVSLVAAAAAVVVAVVDLAQVVAVVIHQVVHKLQPRWASNTRPMVGTSIKSHLYSIIPFAFH